MIFAPMNDDRSFFYMQIYTISTLLYFSCFVVGPIFVIHTWGGYRIFPERTEARHSQNSIARIQR